MSHEAPVAVITGASSGIGAAAALRFAAAGYRLVLGARREEQLANVAERARDRFHAEAVAVPCDVSVPADCRRLVETATERFGRLDVLVCNAGAGFYGRVEDTSVDNLRRLFETNVLGVQACLLAALPVLRRQDAGHVVVVGSVSGKQGWAYHGAYSATKFALTGLVQSLRSELAGSGITATLVLPSTTRTAFFDAASTAGGWKPTPLGRPHAADDVARAILRSVRRPSPEVNLRRSYRLFFALAEAVPLLPDYFRRRYYRRLQRAGGGG